MSLLPTPWPWLKVFDVFPGYVYAAALALIVVGGGAALGVQHVRIAGLERDGAQLVAKIEQDRADRLQLVADHNLKIGLLQAEHAKQQQENVDAFQSEKRTLALQHSRDLDRVGRVQYAAGEQAARDRAAAASDPTACERVADRNEALYGLLAEGFALVVEGRKRLGDRDAEVAVLANIIKNDRATVCPSAP